MCEFQLEMDIGVGSVVEGWWCLCVCMCVTEWKMTHLRGDEEVMCGVERKRIRRC